jgi:hypothetical protein
MVRFLGSIRCISKWAPADTMIAYTRQMYAFLSIPMHTQKTHYFQL